MVWEFWEYITLDFSAWRDGLPKKDRAALDEKMRAIERNGMIPCAKGPLRGYRHLYKIKVRGATIEMRPLFCKGPFVMDGEFTMLAPMWEVGGEDKPFGAKDDAERRRLDVLADRNRRVRYRVPQP